MHVCLVYDCLFPHTVGGGERWYRALAERLAAEGHEVTYLTMRQWPRGEDPGVPGVDVRAVGPQMHLYVNGRRRISQALVFGLGVLLHLLLHGRRYQVVHTSSFPYFSMLAVALLRPLHRYGLVVDWFEVWSRAYWRDYLGRAGGAIGALVQRLCARAPQRAFCLSRLHAARLRAEGMRREPTLLTGLYDGPETAPEPVPAEPVVVYAGRHIPEKRVPAIVPAIALARRELPQLRGTLFGDGPERGEVLAAIEREGLEGVVEAPGFVERERVERALRSALCLVLASSREGYGLVVVEAAARATPVVVVAGADNAATELVEDDVNGFVAASAAPGDVAAAIARVQAGGFALRERTGTWFAHNRQRLSLEHSLATVLAAYEPERPPATRIAKP